MTVQVNFNSHYDAPVRLAAMLVNALTPGQARGRPYAAPLGDERRAAATEALRSVRPDLPTVPADEADRLVAYAAELRAVFTGLADGNPGTAAGHLNRLLEATMARPEMACHDEQAWHVHYRGTAGGTAAEWAGTCATALGIVLGSDARHRLGLCTAPRCDRVHVDTSHNGTRRFCSTACQNRVKAAAFRERRARR